MDQYDTAVDQSLTVGEGEHAHTENSVRVDFILGSVTWAVWQLLG